MGPTIRLLGYREPWWDASGRVARRRRRRRVTAFWALLVLGASLGFAAAQVRGATLAATSGPATEAAGQTGSWSSVTRSLGDSTR
jgi:hypothetical protein